MNYLLYFEQHQVQKLSWQYSMSRFSTTLCLFLVYLKFSISRSCFEGFAEQMPGSIIFAIENNGCSGHLNFWFRIVNMCKTLSQIKRLGKYFQRWSERKGFAQVSTRRRKWERKKKILKTFSKQSEQGVAKRRRRCPRQAGEELAGSINLPSALWKPWTRSSFHFYLL